MTLARGPDPSRRHKRTLRTVHLPLPRGGHLVADELEGDGPAFVFLHGLGSSRAGEKGESLLAWARRHGRAMLRLDFRGHGQSTGDVRQLTLTDLVADAEAALAHVQRAVLVGSSLGGLVAAWVAARQPLQVAGLVLVAPAFGFIERLARHDRRDGRLRIENEWVSLEIDEHVFEDAKRWSEPSLPAQITAPTLIVHGQLDAVVPADASQQVFAALAAVRKELWLVADGDHRLLAHIESVWPRMARLLGEA